jgi:hypothetical protein
MNYHKSHIYICFVQYVHITCLCIHISRFCLASDVYQFDVRLVKQFVKVTLSNDCIHVSRTLYMYQFILFLWCASHWKLIPIIHCCWWRTQHVLNMVLVPGVSIGHIPPPPKFNHCSPTPFCWQFVRTEICLHFSTPVTQLWYFSVCFVLILI